MGFIELKWQRNTRRSQRSQRLLGYLEWLLVHLPVFFYSRHKVLLSGLVISKPVCSSLCFWGLMESSRRGQRWSLTWFSPHSGAALSQMRRQADCDTRCPSCRCSPWLPQMTPGSLGGVWQEWCGAASTDTGSLSNTGAHCAAIPKVPVSISVSFPISHANPISLHEGLVLYFFFQLIVAFICNYWLDMSSGLLLCSALFHWQAEIWVAATEKKETHEVKVLNENTDGVKNKRKEGREENGRWE